MCIERWCLSSQIASSTHGNRGSVRYSPSGTDRETDMPHVPTWTDDVGNIE